LFRSDHYLSLYAPTARGSLDAWSTIAALAACTKRIRLGTLVSPVMVRHPAVLARQVATASAISNGRVDLGLGAGWYAREHEAHGFSFPSTADRFACLGEQLEILRGLFTGRPFSYSGQLYTLRDCTFLPNPSKVQIILGGKGGPRLAALVATYADEFNSDQGTPAEVRIRIGRVRAAIKEQGRPPGRGITMSLMTGCIVGRTRAQVRERLSQVSARMSNPSADELARMRVSWIIGTPSEALERLSEFQAAGVERIMLQHHLPEDTEMLELLAGEIIPGLGCSTHP